MKILIADDTEVLCRVYKRTLEINGHEVYVAEQVDEAKKIIRNQYLDLGIIDFDFKEQEDGIDLAVYTRKIKKRFPIILNTTDIPSAQFKIAMIPAELDPLILVFKMKISELLEKIQEALQMGHNET